MEHEALQDLIKSVDKGTAIVICNKEDCLKECQVQLDNKIVYKELKIDSLKCVTQKVCNTLLNMLRKKEIEKDYSVICWLKILNLDVFISCQRYICE